MAKNKKAQILAAVMCATTVVGVSPAISSAAVIEDAAGGGSAITSENGKAFIEVVDNGAESGLINAQADGLTFTVGENTLSVNGSYTTIGGITIGQDGAISQKYNGFRVTANGDVTARSVTANSVTVDGFEINSPDGAYLDISGTKIYRDGGFSTGGMNFNVRPNGDLQMGPDNKFTVQAATGNIITEGNINGVHVNTFNDEGEGRTGDVMLTAEGENPINVSRMSRTTAGIERGIGDNGWQTTIEGKTIIDNKGNLTTGAVSATNVTTTTGADLNAINDTLTGYKNAGLIAGTNNGEYNTVMGYDSWSNGDYNTVIGNQANIDGSFGVALGAHATVVGNNSVAIGYNSQALRDDVVSVGSFGQERQITNVAAGTENTDAVNYGQLKEVKTDLGGVSANVAGITRTGSDEEGYTTDIEGTIQVNNDGTFRAGNDKNYIGMSDAALNARFNGNGLSIGFDGTSVFGGKTRVDYNDNGATFYYGTSDEQLEYGTTNIKGGNIATNNIVVGQDADAVKIGNGDVELADGTKLSSLADKVDTVTGDVSGLQEQVGNIQENVGGISREENEDGSHTTVINEDTSIKGDLNVDGTINGVTIGKDQAGNTVIGDTNLGDLATNEQVSDLTGRVGTVETDVKGIKEDIGDVSTIDSEIKGDNIVSSINNEASIRRSEVARIDSSIEQLDGRVSSLEDRMGDVEDRIDKVGAMAAAIANLRTMGYDPEAPTEIAVGVGQYKSETGLALGVFHYPNQDFMLSASISTSGDEVMGGIGATWKIGRKSAQERAIDDEKSRELKAEEKAAEMQEAAQKAKVDAQRERHAQMLAEREAANK